jgi:phosphoglycolate phosphatase-like HAD superfamily hydrolase
MAAVCDDRIWTEEDMTTHPEAARLLAGLEPQHEFFVGIDSDGCAFDTMEVKHKECFIPQIIKHWGLQAVSKYAREAAEFVNLYSRWRGINRWPALVMTCDLLRDRAEVRARGIDPPELPRLREFIAADAYPKSDAGLAAYMADRDDAELATALAWTREVNAAVAEMVHGVPPFPGVRDSLGFLADRADMLVVSATPVEALEREWREHGIARFVSAIAGQEMGKKAVHLELAAKGRYAADRILMIGDAPGDLRAARAVDALFYPINPGHEEESWRRFTEEAVHRFLATSYAGGYEKTLIEEFERRLPELPPWQR